MLVAYTGTHPLLPLLACQIHLENNPQAIAQIQKLLRSSRDWQHDPLEVLGRDAQNNVICCLVNRRHGAMYQRAINGVARLFNVTLRMVDIDAMLDRQASYPFYMAACLTAIHCQGPLWTRQTEKLLALLRPHIAGSR